MSTDLRGYALKLASTAAKGLFLFWIVPTLPENVFAQYFLTLTLSVVVARVLGFGGVEAFAKEIGRDKSALADLVSVWILTLAVAVSVGFASLYEDGLIPIAWGLVIAANAMLLGCARTKRHIYFEVGLNLPWLIFLLACAISPPKDLGALFLAQFSAFFITQVAIACLTLKRADLSFSSSGFASGFKRLFLIRKDILSFQASSLNELFFIRGPLVLPDWLGLAMLSDKTALLFSVFEAGWQLFMVPVNRRFSEFVAGTKTRLEMVPVLVNAVALFTACLLVFVALHLLASNFTIPIDLSGITASRAALLALILASTLLLLDARNFWLTRLESPHVIKIQTIGVLIYLVGIVAEMRIFGSLVLGPIAAAAVLVSFIYWSSESTKPRTS